MFIQILTRTFLWAVLIYLSWEKQGSTMTTRLPKLLMFDKASWSNFAKSYYIFFTWLIYSVKSECSFLQWFHVFFRIRIEYSVRILEKTDQNNSEYGQYFLRSASFFAQCFILKIAEATNLNLALFIALEPNEKDDYQSTTTVL